MDDASDICLIQSTRMQRMKWELLNQLLHGVHDVDTMMMRLIHLKYLLGGTHGVDDLKLGQTISATNTCIFSDSSSLWSRKT